MPLVVWMLSPAGATLENTAGPGASPIVLIHSVSVFWYCHAAEGFSLRSVVCVLHSYVCFVMCIVSVQVFN